MTKVSDVLLDMVADAAASGELNGLGLALDSIVSGMSQDTGIAEVELRAELDARIHRKRRELLMLRMVAGGLTQKAV